MIKEKIHDDLSKDFIELKLNEIIPYSQNNRKHTKNDIDEIIKSIQKDGYIAPIIVDENNVIIAGHGRLEALKKLKLKQVKVLKICGMSEEQKKDYRIRDNTTSLLAEFDLDNLRIELQELGDFSIDILDHLQDFELDLWGGEAKTYNEEIEDEVSEVDEKCIVQKGDIFQLGEHRLICGDSTDKETINKLVDIDKIDMGFTSPPYNVSSKGEKKYKNYSDNLSNYLQFLLDYTKITIEKCKYSFNNIQFLEPNKLEIIKYLETLKTNFCDVMIWDKVSGTPNSNTNILRSDFEFIFIFADNPNGRKVGVKKFVGNISNIYRGTGNKHNEFANIHKAIFPIHLPQFFIETFVPKGGSVLDVHGGLGTTLIASEKTGRKCYMNELDPLYCQMIIKRYYKITSGKKEISCLNRDFNFSFLED